VLLNPAAQIHEMIYCDPRIGNNPKYILSETEPVLMLVPDEVRKCVAFVGYRERGGMVKLAGTCFFAFREIAGFGVEHNFAYAITARHVIDAVRDKSADGKVLLRCNLTNDRARWLDTDIGRWKFHPDADEVVDVAVLTIHIPAELDHLAYPLSNAATSEVIAAQGIGIGEEVFLTGLFAPHHGEHRNIPIVRVGNIAAMPEEKVSTSMGLMDAYLIEARSIGGLSGSPVFAHLGLMRNINDRVQFARAGAGVIFLLGLMHGHFAPQTVGLDGTSEDAVSRDRINMGIAIVTPIARILEVVNQPDIRQAETALEEQLRREALPVMDTAQPR
jgi:hypothetical protein